MFILNMDNNNAYEHNSRDMMSSVLGGKMMQTPRRRFKEGHTKGQEMNNSTVQAHKQLNKSTIRETIDYSKITFKKPLSKYRQIKQVGIKDIKK